MQFDIARANMIEQQIRPWNVLQMKTLKALSEVRRENFVPEASKELAYVDMQIPLNDKEVMLEPKLSARMAELLEVEKKHHVLQIGTGSGYLTALLAILSKQVTSIEIDPVLNNQASLNLATAGVSNIQLIHDDAFSFINQLDEESYDRIILAGSVPKIEKKLFDILTQDGCLVGVQGNNPTMELAVMTKKRAYRAILETSVPRLNNVVETIEFKF